MSDGRHTPAPWEADGIGSDGSFEVWNAPFKAQDGFIICSRNPIDHRAEESRANAHLIAAAPMMLDALRAALPHLDNSDSPGGCDGSQFSCAHCEAIRLVRAVIKRATKA